jgi:hypothetical protein
VEANAAARVLLRSLPNSFEEEEYNGDISGEEDMVGGYGEGQNGWGGEGTGGRREVRYEECMDEEMLYKGGAFVVGGEGTFRKVRGVRVWKVFVEGAEEGEGR